MRHVNSEAAAVNHCYNMNRPDEQSTDFSRAVPAWIDEWPSLNATTK